MLSALHTAFLLHPWMYALALKVSAVSCCTSHRRRVAFSIYSPSALILLIPTGGLHILLLRTRRAMTLYGLRVVTPLNGGAKTRALRRSKHPSCEYRDGLSASGTVTRSESLLRFHHSTHGAFAFCVRGLRRYDNGFYCMGGASISTYFPTPSHFLVPV